MSIPTSLPRSSRYYNPLHTKIAFIPEIAAATMIPVYAEWAARCDLSDEIADISGWTVSTEQHPTPGLTRFTGSVPGRDTVQDSTITFYADLDGDDVRKVLTRDLEGYLSFADGGDTAGKLMDVFHIRVTSVGKLRTVSGSTAAQLTVGFSILRAPAEDVEIPAAP